MKIEPGRLTPLLMAVGFRRGLEYSIGSIAFVRAASAPDLWQWIHVESAGARHEAVYAEVSVAITKWIALKGFMESRLLMELAENRERGWTIVESTTKAIKWENKLLHFAPDAAAQFETQLGPALLERTKSLREDVGKYLRKLVLDDSATNARLNIRNDADNITLDEADRLMASAAIRHVPGSESLYELACLCILRYSTEVEAPGITYFGQDPLENTHLMLRIQLLVDKLLSHFRYACE